MRCKQRLNCKKVGKWGTLPSLFPPSSPSLFLPSPPLPRSRSLKTSLESGERCKLPHGLLYTSILIYRTPWLPPLGSWVKPWPQTHYGVSWARKSHLAASPWVHVSTQGVKKKSAAAVSARRVFKKLAQHRSGALQFNLKTGYKSSVNSLTSRRFGLMRGRFWPFILW